MVSKMKENAFTLIELLVVIAVIALLVAIIIPSLGRAKELAHRIICRNNIRQQALGTTVYAQENNANVPTVPGAGGWLWDISFWSTNRISEFAGFDDNEVYFCPANRIKKASDARYWQHSWVFEWNVDLTQEQSLRDESNLPLVRQKQLYRVPSTLYMFDKIDEVTGNSILPATLITGEDAKWISKLTQVKGPASTVMLMDAVISELNEWNFFEIRFGGVGNYFNAFDSSNHKSTLRSPKNNHYFMPSGANVGYADGHVDWRDFDKMEHRITQGMWFWW